MQLEASAKIRELALSLLARREHSHQELLAKLERKGFERELILAELKKLEAQRLQSDERFCEAYVHERVRLGYGPRQIEQALRQKGITEELIAQYLEDLGYDFWNEVMTKVWQKKFGAKQALGHISAAEQAKQFRFLSYRGFESQAIYSLLRKGINIDVVSDEQ